MTDIMDQSNVFHVLWSTLGTPKGLLLPKVGIVYLTIPPFKDTVGFLLKAGSFRVVFIFVGFHVGHQLCCAQQTGMHIMVVEALLIL